MAGCHLRTWTKNWKYVSRWYHPNAVLNLYQYSSVYKYVLQLSADTGELPETIEEEVSEGEYKRKLL